MIVPAGRFVNQNHYQMNPAYRSLLTLQWILVGSLSHCTAVDSYSIQGERFWMKHSNHGLTGVNCGVISNHDGTPISVNNSRQVGIYLCTKTVVGKRTPLSVMCQHDNAPGLIGSWLGRLYSKVLPRITSGS